MKKTCNFLFGIILLLLLINSIYNYNQNKKILNTQKILSDSNNKKDNYISTLLVNKENRILEINFNGKIINKNLTVTNTNKENIKLLKLIQGNKLVLRYSYLNCKTCIDEQINILNTYIDSIGVENVLLLTNYQNDIYMRKFKKINKIKFKILNISNGLDSIIKDIGLPYFFILTDKDSRIQNTFIPIKGSSQQTKDYLQAIKQKYFEEK